MRRCSAFLFFICFSAAMMAAQTYQPTWDSLDRRPTPQWFSEARFGIFIHWGTYSVPAYAPVIPGKLAYAEWYWHAMSNGRYNSKANELEKGTWAFHQKVYGADFAYDDFAPRFNQKEFWTEVSENTLIGTPLPNLDIVVSDEDSVSCQRCRFYGIEFYSVGYIYRERLQILH